ncbi:THAP domain-containing protein 5 [Plakobranchus ocellatus]|uniref:THAP domain-containing protein 5 n=1 Tax=Plakobranchus ocellatus TaxID=259542 RepID=A0AAV4ATE3_9GAST|nr:THAP domain-containing protein 5 [Plakobranchus ocellatus]
MGRKCSVYGCKTGYSATDEKISVYSFPKDKDELEKWVRNLPNNISADQVTKYMGVCALHWPKDTELVRTKGRYYVLAVPPSIFENIPESRIPSISKTTPRSTKKVLTRLSATRAVDIYEMETFMDNDKLKEDTFFDLFKAKSEALGLFAADHLRTNFALFSKTRTGPIPLLSVYFTLTVINSVVTLQYEAYQNLKRVFHPSIKASIRC